MYSFDLTSIDSRCAKIPWSKGPRKLCAFIYSWLSATTVCILKVHIEYRIAMKFGVSTHVQSKHEPMITYTFHYQFIFGEMN